MAPYLTASNSHGKSFMHPRDPLRIIQFTDTHIFTTGDEHLDGINTLASFRQVVSLARRNHWPADAVVVTGDLVHDPTPAAYRLLRRYLTEIEAPVYCIPGNHDDPTLMTALLPGDNIHVVQNACIGGWHVIFLDTYVPGWEGGHLDEAGLKSLEACLQTYPQKPTLICLHHPPVPIQSQWMDAMALDNPQAFFAILDRFTQVRAVIWGHIHQEFSKTRNGVQLLGSPSTCVQFRPNVAGYAKDRKQAGYRWLVLEPGGQIETGIERL
jgi:3',5'-cyclic-AMP phosphodiesterase